MSKLQTILEYAIEQGWRKDQVEKYGLTASSLASQLVREYGDSIEFLFDHGFLKNVFGEGEGPLAVIYDDAKTGEAKTAWMKTVAWKFHARQMVISKDPVGYIYDWIKGQE